MENVGIVYRHSENITAVWYVLFPLGNSVVIWYSFSPFWYIESRKKFGNPESR
jgi:hypothetical protein